MQSGRRETWEKRRKQAPRSKYIVGGGGGEEEREQALKPRHQRQSHPTAGRKLSKSRRARPEGWFETPAVNKEDRPRLY